MTEQTVHVGDARTDRWEKPSTLCGVSRMAQDWVLHSKATLEFVLNLWAGHPDMTPCRRCLAVLQTRSRPRPMPRSALPNRPFETTCGECGQGIERVGTGSFGPPGDEIGKWAHVESPPEDFPVHFPRPRVNEYAMDARD